MYINCFFSFQSEEGEKMDVSKSKSSIEEQLFAEVKRVYTERNTCKCF